MNTEHTEFFPGLSGEEGMTFCSGWQLPQGVSLILPFSLISVEPEQDRYSEHYQLWRDADGEYWIINYCDTRCEWYASNEGYNSERARANLASALEDQ